MKKILFTLLLIAGSFGAQAQTELEGVFFEAGGDLHGVYSPVALDKCYSSLGTEGTDYSVVTYTLSADGSTITIGSGSPTAIPTAFRANYISTFARNTRLIRFVNANNQTLAGIPTLSESN